MKQCVHIWDDKTDGGKFCKLCHCTCTVSGEILPPQVGKPEPIITEQ